MICMAFRCPCVAGFTHRWVECCVLRIVPASCVGVSCQTGLPQQAHRWSSIQMRCVRWGSTIIAICHFINRRSFAHTHFPSYNISSFRCRYLIDDHFISTHIYHFVCNMDIFLDKSLRLHCGFDQTKIANRVFYDSVQWWIVRIHSVHATELLYLPGIIRKRHLAHIRLARSVCSCADRWWWKCAGHYTRRHSFIERWGVGRLSIPYVITRFVAHQMMKNTFCCCCCLIVNVALHA